MKKIGLSPDLVSPGYKRLFDALGEVLKVTFEERSAENDSTVAAWVLQGEDHKSVSAIKDGRPCYIVMPSDQLEPCGESARIDFARHTAVTATLSGRQIASDEAVELKALPGWLDHIEVIASKEGAPVWAIQERNQPANHYVAMPIPQLPEDVPLFSLFNEKRFLSLLPLLVFLRAVTEDQRWEQPPLQACLMIDDPNLHWRTYGFVNYAEIAAHAQIHNYHVSFAMIPLDAWFVHKPTAILFRQYRDRLSLLVHGNDHISKELARIYSEKERNRVLQQALRRIALFERCSGVEVSRVMAPPHGACSESTLREMARMGFEAACVSRGSLHHYNGQASWLRTLGMSPSDIIGGLPVFPRFSFAKNCQNNILVAALLHQPIIAMGHHHDIAEGLHPFAALARFVNSLGTVHWSDMKRISRSNYARCLDGNILRVRMFARRIEVSVPEGINHIRVERPWLRQAHSLPYAWRHVSDRAEWKVQHPDKPVFVSPGKAIEISAELPPAHCIDSETVRRLQLWPILRRQLTEARDRITPLLR